MNFSVAADGRSLAQFKFSYQADCQPPGRLSGGITYSGVVAIAADGSITIVPRGGDPNQPQAIDRLKLASTKGSDTVKGLDNLLRVRGGGVLPDDMDATVQTGALEGSNVNMTEALVDMIENQRAYEVQANLLKEARTMDEGGASLMRLPS